MSTATVESLELSRIVPSSTNPRKSFDQVALEQLAQSIKEIGITVPLLVRPFEKQAEGETQFELVSGHRRLKAATLAGLELVPAIVREMSDAEALDVQMVENLQRADLHPMDEAAGYQQLIDAAAARGERLTQEELSHKVGKPLSYVVQRTKLLDLAETPRKVFQEGLINIGHALVLARLTPELQDQGLRSIFDPHGQNKKLKTAAEVVEKRVADVARTSGMRATEPASSVASLKDWVKWNVELNLDEAPWDLAATNLHPTATSCNACPKRTSNNPALFAEMTAEEDKCMDPDCFEVKTKTFIHITVTGPTLSGKPMLRLSHNHSFEPLDGTEKEILKGQWREVDKGSCPDAREGVMVKGGATGRIKWVCINQKCKTHKHTVQRREQASARSSEPKLPKGTSKEEFEAQKKREADRKNAERLAIYKAIRAEYAKGNRDKCLVQFAVRSLDNEYGIDTEIILKLNGWEKEGGQRWTDHRPFLAKKLHSLMGAEFLSFLFDLAHCDMSDTDSWNDNQHAKHLVELAAEYVVDLDAVVQKVRDENPALYTEPEAKPVAKKKATKKSSKKAEKKATKATAPKPAADRKSAAAGDDDEDLPEFGEPKETCEECGSEDGWHTMSCTRNANNNEDEE